MTDEEIVQTATGLGYVDLVEGTGATPKSGDNVRVHYTGWLKSGEKFDETKMTAAVLPRYWNLLKGKTLRVSSGDESVDVVVNDTGGFEKYGRIVDLSKAAFEKLAPLKQGIIKNVKVEIVEDK